MQWWVLVAFAVFLIGVTKSGFGSGLGLIVVPLTFLAMPHLPGFEAKQTLGLLLPLLSLGDVFSVYQYRKLWDRQTIRRLIPGSLLGIALGSWLLWMIEKQQHLAEALMKVDVGAESAFLVALHWYRVWRAKGELPLYRPGKLKSAAVGAFAGASSTLAHAAGPIIALHLLPQRMDRQVFVGTCAVYFFIVNLCKMPSYAAAGQFEPSVLWLSLKLSPFVLAGAIFGFWVNKRMTDRVFSTIVYVMTFVAGCYILWDGMRRLNWHFHWW